MLVDVLYGVNKLVDWVSSYEGVKPFIYNFSEHPAINYRHVPVKSLYQLRRLIHDMDEYLPHCNIPVLVLHGSHDPIVSVKSAREIMAKLETGNRQLKIIDSNRHGILMENIGGTWTIINEFMMSCSAATEVIRTDPAISTQNEINSPLAPCGCDHHPQD